MFQTLFLLAHVAEVGTVTSHNAGGLRTSETVTTYVYGLTQHTVTKDTALHGKSEAFSTSKIRPQNTKWGLLQIPHFATGPFLLFRPNQRLPLS